MFCKNIARLAVARECIYVWQPLATAKQAIFLQNVFWKSCSKFNFKQCSLKKFLKILIFWREYMEMCFHGNRISWGINHSFISLYSKYQPPSFICSSIMLAPVISSLDEIYCTFQADKSRWCIHLEVKAKKSFCPPKSLFFAGNCVCGLQTLTKNLNFLRSMRKKHDQKYCCSGIARLSLVIWKTMEHF